MMAIERLKAMGFRLAGTCHLHEERLAFRFNELSNCKNVLYSFVADGEVMYIGKTVSRLRQRMSGYRSPGPTQTTNIRNNQKLCALLDAGKTVEIFVLPDNGLLYYGGFHVNLAAGLEDSLIRELRPPWNGGKKEKRDGAAEESLSEPGGTEFGDSA